MNIIRMACLVIVLYSFAILAHGQDIAGEIKNPEKQFGKEAQLRLIDDSSFGYPTRAFSGGLDLNGHAFTMETGGGNPAVFSGVIAGAGDLIWNGGGNANWQTTPSFFSGTQPNTFTGTLTILRGTLAFAKPDGVAAFVGDRLVLGGGSNQSIVRLDASNQIGDSCSILIRGEHEGRIWTRGNSDAVGELELQSNGYLDLGDGDSQLSFTDSSKSNWDRSKSLTIQNWTNGRDIVRFGSTGSGLTADQLAVVGFADPSDMPVGLYTAKLQGNGQLVPGDRVNAIDPPFDVSDEARSKREKIYQIQGRENLSGVKTPLADGMQISFFGDSITWQDNYINEIRKSLATGAGTKNLSVHLHNHGINGGGVLSVRDGVEKAAFVDSKNRDGKQAAFSNVIADDKADVAVVFIGINDVWWRKTSPADFEQALRDIVKSALANKTELVLATLTVHKEKPDGSNSMDRNCDEFAQITRDVAQSTNTTLVDLRSVYLAYLRNQNAELRIDGRLNFVADGILTYDGVHPNAVGNALLADHISEGIVNALKNSKLPRQDEKQIGSLTGIEKIDSILAAREKQGFCGVILIRSGNKTLLHKAYGFADRESSQRMTTAHGFDIGSIVKPMTATAILKLEEQKKLSSEDNLEKFFPDAPNDKREITIQQLLTHRAGLQDIFGGDYQVVDREWLVSKVLNSKLLHPPGSKKQYSNSGYATLAAIIEQCSGESYESFVRTQILRPAGVEKIGYVLPGWKNNELAVGYFESGKRFGTPLDKKWASDGPGWNLRGNGGMLSDAASLSGWYEALCDGEVIGQKALESYYSFGAGKSQQTGSRIMGHAGGNGVFNSLQISYIDADVHMTFLTSAADQQAESIWPEFRNEIGELAIQRTKNN